MRRPVAETWPAAPVDLRIFAFRGHHVVLDSDLAALYGVSTGAFNQAVKRNLRRFPEDFSFVLVPREFQALMSPVVTSKGRGGRRKPPRVLSLRSGLRTSPARRQVAPSRPGVLWVEGRRPRGEALDEVVPRSHRSSWNASPPNGET
jgi:hypothetical protein